MKSKWLWAAVLSTVLYYELAMKVPIPVGITVYLLTWGLGHLRCLVHPKSDTLKIKAWVWKAWHWWSLFQLSRENITRVRVDTKFRCYICHIPSKINQYALDGTKAKSSASFGPPRRHDLFGWRNAIHGVESRLLAVCRASLYHEDMTWLSWQR